MEPFGTQLQAELGKRQAGRQLLGRFTDAEVDALRRSEREQVVVLLAPFLEDGELDVVRNGSAAEVAELFCEETQSPVDPSLPFGGQLYEELRLRKCAGLLTGQLDYAEIQELKAADREDALALARRSFDYEMIQLMKTRTPREFAEAIVERRALAMRVSGGDGWPFWLMFLAMT